MLDLDRSWYSITIPFHHGAPLLKQAQGQFLLFITPAGVTVWTQRPSLSASAAFRQWWGASNAAAQIVGYSASRPAPAVVMATCSVHHSLVFANAFHHLLACMAVHRLSLIQTCDITAREKRYLLHDGVAQDLLDLGILHRPRLPPLILLLRPLPPIQLHQ